jgi:hypothetical protein
VTDNQVCNPRQALKVLNSFISGATMSQCSLTSLHKSVVIFMSSHHRDDSPPTDDFARPFSWRHLRRNAISGPSPRALLDQDMIHATRESTAVESTDSDVRHEDREEEMDAALQNQIRRESIEYESRLGGDEEENVDDEIDSIYGRDDDDDEQENENEKAEDDNAEGDHDDESKDGDDQEKHDEPEGDDEDIDWDHVSPGHRVADEDDDETLLEHDEETAVDDDLEMEGAEEEPPIARNDHEDRMEASIPGDILRLAPNHRTFVWHPGTLVQIRDSSYYSYRRSPEPEAPIYRVLNSIPAGDITVLGANFSDASRTATSGIWRYWYDLRPYTDDRVIRRMYEALRETLIRERSGR